MHGVDSTILWWILLAPIILLVLCGLVLAYGLWKVMSWFYHPKRRDQPPTEWGD